MNEEWAARCIALPILDRVIAGLDVDQAQAPIRTGPVIAEIVGLVVTRYVLKFEPADSAVHDQLVAAIGPTVHHYLVDDLPGVFTSAVESLHSRPKATPKA